MIRSEFVDGSPILALTTSVNNLGSIETRQGSFTNNFSLPLTDNNRRLFGFADDVNNTSRTPYTKLQAELYDDDTLLDAGYIKITEVTNNEIKCTFFGSNSDWFSLTKDKTLQDITLDEINHSWTPAAITASVSNTSGYIYPYINYGYSDKKKINNWLPAVYVHTIVDGIFKDIDYNLEGSLLNNRDYKRMIIPFSKDKFTTDGQDVTPQTDTLGSDTLFSTGTLQEIFSTTATSNGVFDLTFQLALVSPPGGLDIRMYYYNGTQTTQISRFNTSDFSESAVVVSDIELATGDTIGLYYSLVPGSFTASGTDTFITQTRKESQLFEGDTVKIRDILPNIKQNDFLKYLFNLFGVVCQVNVLTKTVSLNHFRDITTIDAVDWSEKIDIATEKSLNFTELIQDYASKSLLTYKTSDDDTLLTDYKDQNGVNFGTGVLNIDNEHLNKEDEIYESPFAGTFLFNTDHPTTDPEPIGIQIPFIPLYEDDEFKLKPEFRILLVEPDQDAGIINSNIDLIEVEGQSTTVSTSKVAFAWFDKSLSTTEVNELQGSLSFADQSYFGGLVQNTGKISEFWEGYKDVLSNHKYITAQFKLNAVDLAALDFLKAVYIDYYKSYFFINSINEYTGDTDLTEVELIKL